MTREELLELKHLEFQEKEKEAQLRLKEIELSTQLKLRELEICGVWESFVDRAETLFDVSKHIKVVPTFGVTNYNIRYVDKYFLHLKKVAKSQKWPKD